MKTPALLRGMKTVTLLLFIVLPGLAAQHAFANEAGDVGSAECLMVQNDVQQTVISGAPYKNHGQMVKAAAHATGKAKASGDITGQCASCITRQFAKRLPIDEQAPCGKQPNKTVVVIIDPLLENDIAIGAPMERSILPGS